jgi:hypothetical protein
VIFRYKGVKMYDKDILSFDLIQQGLKDKRLHQIGKEIGVSYPTLKRLADGVEANYTIGTLTVVSNYVRSSQLDLG